MKDLITVRFSCRSCGLVDVPCIVECRDEGQDVCDYVGNTIGTAIGNKHRLRSPNCQTTLLSDLKIPVNPVKGIGFHTTNIPPEGKVTPIEPS